MVKISESDVKKLPSIVRAHVAAKALGLRIPSIYEWIRNDGCPSIKNASGERLLDRHEFISWLKRTRRIK